MKFSNIICAAVFLFLLPPLCAQQNRDHQAFSLDLYQAAFNYYELSYENAPFSKISFNASLGYSPALRWTTGVSAYGCALGSRFYPWGAMAGFFAAMSPRAYWMHTSGTDSGVYTARAHSLVSVIDLGGGYRWYPRKLFGDKFFVEPSVSYMFTVLSGTFETVNKDEFSMKNKYPVEAQTNDGISIALKCGVSF